MTHEPSRACHPDPWAISVSFTGRKNSSEWHCEPESEGKGQV
jgi:hypothetical protein